MKYSCPCGYLLYDGPDQNPNIAHLIPDQDWFRWLDAVDAAIERDHPTAKDKEAACMSLRTLLGEISRPMWQCPECGRLWILDPECRRQEFAPATEAARKILRGAPEAPARGDGPKGVAHGRADCHGATV
jgi:hypothetical protein